MSILPFIINRKVLILSSLFREWENKMISFYTWMPTCLYLTELSSIIHSRYHAGMFFTWRFCFILKQKCIITRLIRFSTTKYMNIYWWPSLIKSYSFKELHVSLVYHECYNLNHWFCCSVYLWSWHLTCLKEIQKNVVLLQVIQSN